MRMLALLLIAASAAPALANPTITVAGHNGRFPSVAVPYGDLNLASATGQRRLDARLWQAAGEVCTMTHMRDLSESRLADRCRRAALATVRPARDAALAD
ncbi:MAG: UrcA family protein [Sphingomonadales bacterium]|jgi:UrcA family protein